MIPGIKVSLTNEDARVDNIQASNIANTDMTRLYNGTYFQDDFRVTEKTKLEFRAEIFNLTNPSQLFSARFRRKRSRSRARFARLHIAFDFWHHHVHSRLPE